MKNVRTIGQTVCLLLAMISLNGCEQIEAMRQQQFQAQQAKLQAQRQQQIDAQEQIDNAKQACLDSMADPALDPIRDKVAFDNVENQPLTIRTNTSFPTKKERATLVIWDQKRDDCYTKAQIIFAKLPPQIKVVFDAYKGATDSLTAQLYLRKITYGDFATQRQNNELRLESTIADIQHTLQLQNQQARFQAEQIANQAAEVFNAQQQTKAMQDMARQAGKSTHCTSYGNSTDCSQW